MRDKAAWDKEYKKLCCEFMGMNPFEAEMHFRSAADFDRGYSPIFYITEEINSGHFEKKENKKG